MRAHSRGRRGRPQNDNVAERRKPNSVRRRPACAERPRDDHSSSPVIADGIQQPTRKCVERAVRSPTSLALGVVTSLFGLAPCGVLPAADVATGAVRSYRTFSPLPRRSGHRPRRRAVCFLCHCPSSCPDRALPGALPCGVRTFLPSTRRCGQVERRSSGALRRPDCLINRQSPPPFATVSRPIPG
jgi:hypothetical protein